MAGQATMNGSAPAGQAPGGVFDSVSALGNDLTNLATLQLRLAGCDARETIKRLAPSLVLGVVGLILLPSSLVIALIGAAYWVAATSNWTLPQALLLVGGVGAVIAAIAIVLALRLGRGSLVSFRRSSEELQHNIAWMRTVLKYSGR